MSPITAADEKRFRLKYHNKIDTIIGHSFEHLPIGKRDRQRLEMMAVGLFSRSPDKVSAPHASGLVIAGFGRDDVFPALVSFSLEGVFEEHLRWFEDRNAAITDSNDAQIVPFAQHEMVVTFMEGVDPSYQEAIQQDLRQILVEYPPAIIDRIVELDEKAKQRYKNSFRESGRKALAKYAKDLRSYRQSKHVEPVMAVVAGLPKDELAAVAESLVSLTSFKRRVSLEEESVGGPIDVAVISKGDGLIWIKRKHYFAPELNQQFIARCYKEEGHAE